MTDRHEFARRLTAAIKAVREADERAREQLVVLLAGRQADEAVALELDRLLKDSIDLRVAVTKLRDDLKGVRDGKQAQQA
ncbi:MAG TPA: hypothetical protein VJ011_05655 [Steroidobacteraceae bacterium]|nr:hypothetical protein [Steroidobacteraceae bacterium]HLA13468.1 hypothetical protein [Gemmatimonadaceae bacterium]